ncbi:MAG: manganese efflux pump MntP family protein [Oscillospiraceae bacterium]|nr:manganese efflux pump MntP family protein [Oscillospiraceae bacterium]
MGLTEIILLAVGLSMDAFAVSVCKGLAIPKINLKKAAICGIWFGGFQALMPIIGYLLGAGFTGYITGITPWIAFVLLSLIGGNMIKEAVSKEEEKANDSLGFKVMLTMAVATSIDALAVGVTFACVPVSIMSFAGNFLNTLLGAVIIGVTTFALSCIGVKIGNIFGLKYKSKAELAGGIILICLGIKILLEHFNIL